MPEEVDGHLVIINDGYPVGIAHKKEELEEKMYSIAKKYAEGVAESLSSDRNHNYIFIDVTSRGDKAKAEELSKIIENVSVPGEYSDSLSTLRRIKAAKL